MTEDASVPVRSRSSWRRGRRGLIVGFGIALATVALVTMSASWIVSTGPGQAFMQRYPGDGPLPADVPIGLPGWVCWQHFFNLFLMALLIRSGLQAHYEKRPRTWTSRRDPEMTMPLSGWLHMVIDPAWMLNGLIFIVLLGVSGQWMRIVPTSWAVLPNAVSAALGYASLNWPTENGWVCYNALQQLAYFVTVFVAAPLSVLTGLRQTPKWPRAGLRRVNGIFTERVARTMHFSLMGYFVVFIVVHVGLVLSTGARSNLNYMFAANDGTSLAGVVVFVIAVAITMAAWFAARPFVLAPIATRFGEVD